MPQHLLLCQLSPLSGRHLLSAVVWGAARSRVGAFSTTISGVPSRPGEGGARARRRRNQSVWLDLVIPCVGGLSIALLLCLLVLLLLRERVQDFEQHRVVPPSSSPCSSFPRT